MNLDPRLGTSEGNSLPQPDLGLFNSNSHNRNQQTLRANTQPAYEEGTSGGHLTTEHPAHSHKPVTGEHFGGENYQGHFAASHYPSQSRATRLDNNYSNDNSSMDHGGNQLPHMSENSAMDPKVLIDPHVGRIGPAGKQLGEQAVSYADESASSWSLARDQQHGISLPTYSAVPTPSLGERISSGPVQFAGMGGGIPHPAQFVANHPALQYAPQNMQLSSLPSNNSPHKHIAPKTPRPNFHQTPLQNVPTLSGRINPLSASSGSVSHGARKLKISRYPHRPYTEDDFKGIRKGGKRMLNGEWDAETKGNHYPSFLVYHGRPEFQPSQDKNANFKKRTSEAKSLSPNDKLLLLDFVKANKYWRKHKRLPNYPNFVMIAPGGNDDNASDVEDELPDPDEIDAVEEEMLTSAIQTSIQDTTTQGKHALNEARGQIEGTPLGQPNRPNNVQASQAITKEFVNLQQINRFLVKENLPSLLDLANHHLQSIGRSPVRLMSKKSSPNSSSSLSKSSASAEMTEFKSQEYEQPHTAIQATHSADRDYGPASDVGSEHELLGDLEEALMTTVPTDSSNFDPPSIKSRKRKAVGNEDNDFMRQIPNTNQSAHVGMARTTSESEVDAHENPSTIQSRRSQALNLDGAGYSSSSELPDAGNFDWEKNVDQHGASSHGFDVPADGPPEYPGIFIANQNNGSHSHNNFAADRPFSF